MKYPETDLQNEKDKSSSDVILTREEGTALCRRVAQKVQEYQEYMRMMRAKEREAAQSTEE